jgi:NitT/TauT family transport system substrate-binding protein
MEQQGVAIRRLELPAAYQHLSSYGFPVTAKMIAEHPDLIARFGRAFAKGSVACQANPAGCLTAYWKQEPDQKPAVLDDAATKRALAVLKVRLDNMEIPQAGPTRLGAFSDADWTGTMQYLAAGGQIADPNITLDSLFTNRFVADYNQFDIAEVVKKAQAYGGAK